MFFYDATMPGQVILNIERALSWFIMQETVTLLLNF